MYYKINTRVTQYSEVTKYLNIICLKIYYHRITHKGLSLVLVTNFLCFLIVCLTHNTVRLEYKENTYIVQGV